MQEDPYSILNVSTNTTQKQLKEQYYKYSRTFHPDKQSAELYDIAKKYFEKIESAYKAISTPYTRSIYDQFGLIGINMYDRYQNKFLEFESEFENENYDKKDLKKRIQSRMLYLMQQEQEAQQFAGIYRLISVQSQFNLYQGQWFNTDSKINIPLTQQTEFGLDFSIQGSQAKYGYFVKYHDYIHPYKLGKIMLNSSLNINPDNLSLNSQIQKELGEQGSLGCNFYLDPQLNHAFNVTYSRVLSNVQQMSITSNSQNFNIYYAHDLKYFKFSSGLDLSSEVIGASLNLDKKIQKNLTLVIGKSVKVNTQGQVDFSIYTNLKYKVNHYQKVEVTLNFGESVMNKIYVRFQRYGFSFDVPVVLLFFTKRQQFLIQTIFYAASLGLFKLMDHIKHKRKLKRMKLISQQKSRLSDQHKYFHDLLSEIQQFSEQNRQIEINNGGIVITKGYLGYSEVIYKYYTQPSQFTNMDFQSYLEQCKTINDHKNYTEQIINIADILQYYVVDGYLSFNLEQIKKIDGIYNPCLRENIPSILFIEYLINGELKKIIISDSKDHFIGNFKQRSNYSLLNLFQYFNFDIFQ